MGWDGMQVGSVDGGVCVCVCTQYPIPAAVWCGLINDISSAIDPSIHPSIHPQLVFSFVLFFFPSWDGSDCADRAQYSQCAHRCRDYKRLRWRFAEPLTMTFCTQSRKEPKMDPCLGDPCSILRFVVCGVACMGEGSGKCEV